MARPKIVLTRRWPATVEDEIRRHFDLVRNESDRPMNADAITETLCTAVAVFPTVTDRIDANVLDVRPMRARFLGNYGVSYNHIDLDAARNADLAVTDTPDVLTDATADLTLALLLAVARRLGKASGSYATAHGAVGARRTLSALRSVEKPSG